jgi:hypothetical protein
MRHPLLSLTQAMLALLLVLLHLQDHQKFQQGLLNFVSSFLKFLDHGLVLADYLL